MGRTLDGKSVSVCITNATPHFSIKIPFGVNIPVLMDSILKMANKYIVAQRIKNAIKDEKKTVPNILTAHDEDLFEYSVIKGQDILEYDEESPATFVNMQFQSPWDAKLTSDFLQKGVCEIVEYQRYKYGHRIFEKQKYLALQLEDDKLEHDFIKLQFDRYKTYNDHVDFTLQYLIDKDIYSCSFIEVQYLQEATPKKTFCDVEIISNTIRQVDVKDMAPWRILSYDIESLPYKIEGKINKYEFPDANRLPEGDPIVTIGAVLQIGSETTQYVWILRPFDQTDEVESFSPLDDPPDEYQPELTTVFNFNEECAMLVHFVDFIREKDVDFIEGHNVNRFDNAYLLDRYLHEVGVRPVLGRVKNTESFIKKSTFQSNQKGAIEKFKLIMPGRIVLDSYDIFKDQHNESSYKLDSLAAKYLGTKKIEQDYNDIHPMYHSGAKGRHDLAIYCVKDSWLVRKMMDKLCKLTVLLQMSNVTGISMKDVIERGQGIRTIALMIRYAKRRKVPYFIPRLVKEPKFMARNTISKSGMCERVMVEKEGDSFEGAVVVSPTTGFYTDAVSCLDFASLYPSIMRALNMSYETLVSKETVARMKWDQLKGKEERKGVRTIPDFSYVDMFLKTSINEDSPTFVSKSVRKGLLPEILESVLFERKAVKKMMKALNDPSCTMYKVYDGRQLGLKVVANSIYGFTGALHGFLPEKRIASSVTKYGRYMITQTKDKVENHPVWGKEHGCKCIYGDTDSVFVHMPRSLVDADTEEGLMKKAHEKGTEMADYITNIFLPPNELEYEKSYSSFLLLKKKRYAGHKYEPGHPPKLQIKGLEAARRDYAPLLVQTQKKMLNILLLERDKKKAIAYVKDVVQKLMKNEIDLSLLVMSKKLSRPPKEYKSRAAHVNLALRLEKDNPQTAPVSGDRVDYVIYCSASSKTSESACLPSEIKSGRYQVDRDYYLEKQLKGPLLRILDKVVTKPEDVFQCSVIFKPRPKYGIFSSFLKKRKAELEGCSPEEKSKKVSHMIFGNR